MNVNTYRSDIDGLRTIAVLSVVLHHINADTLPGGFVGVDIFFVISGFLITSQIYKEIIEKSFSLKQFYKKRINRIIPALLVVISISLILGFFILSPRDLIRLASSSFLSVVGLSNVYFWKEYGNYFSENVSEAPLLHTWSLGVEEQFYIVWPIFLIFLLKLRHSYIFKITFPLTLLMIAISEFGVQNFTSASYYLLPTRFFELMMGGIMGILLSNKNKRSHATSVFSSTTGLLLIAGSLFVLTPEKSFPGLNALFPCLGAALIIWSSNNLVSNIILQNRPVVFLGKISYSIYLWHWPIIAYLNYTGLAIDFPIGLSIFATSSILAWLTWRFIEVHFRKSGVTQRFQNIFIYRFAIPAIILLAVFGLTLILNGFPQRFEPQVSLLESMASARPEKIREKCHMPTALYKREISNDCRIGINKIQVDAILVGDSFANHFTGMLDVLAIHDGITITDYTMDGCPPILNYQIGKNLSYIEKCQYRNNIAYDLIKKNKYKYVILSANWPEDESTFSKIDDSISEIINSGSIVIVILSNQRIKNAATCPIRNLMLKKTGDCAVYQTERPMYWEYIKQKHPDIHFLDPSSIICTKGICNPVIKGTLLYRDDVHLNDIGSRLIGNMLVTNNWSLTHSSVDYFHK